MAGELERVETLRAEVAPVVQRAMAVQIVTPDDYAATAETTKQVKAAIKQVDAFFDPMVRANLEATRRTNEAKATLRSPLVEAEKLLKQKQLDWQAEQERIRQREQARLQAEADERARREREKAEQEAARQRAIQAEQERAAAELRRQSESYADAAERARLQREAAAADRKAAAAAVKVEAKQEQAAAVVAPVVTVASVAPEIKGQSIRKTWRAVVVDAKAVPRDWLIVNDSALQAFARATKGAVVVAGVEFREEASLASASR
jgi:hypothetical protein